MEFTIIVLLIINLIEFIMLRRVGFNQNVLNENIKGLAKALHVLDE